MLLVELENDPELVPQLSTHYTTVKHALQLSKANPATPNPAQSTAFLVNGEAGLNVMPLVVVG